jgi:DNA-binding NtrC family response regulator
MAGDSSGNGPIRNTDYKANVLVVDGDVRCAKDLVPSLKGVGHNVIWARDGEAGYNVLDSEEPINVMISELNAHHIDGMRLLQIAKKRNPEICVIVITREPEIELATEAMRRGAYDFQTKPLNVDKIIAVIERGLSHQKLAGELTELKKRMDHRYGFTDIIGGSQEIIKVFERIKQVADTRTTVLICGETGTGKELVAKAIHHNSSRKDCPFVMLNCAALADGVIESELFGHEKGAFTGAVTERRGRFEIADGGTLFLDEVGEMPLSTQGKLLRVLQEREFERVGGNKTMKVDVRVIAATNQDLAKLVEQGKYREPLYYRLNVARIDVPPLRDRKQDIPLLVDTFIREFNK